MSSHRLTVAGTRTGAERRSSVDTCTCAALQAVCEQVYYSLLVVARDDNLLYANGLGRDLLDGDTPFAKTKDGRIEVQGQLLSRWVRSQSTDLAPGVWVAIRHRPALAASTLDYRVALVVSPRLRDDDSWVLKVFGTQTKRRLDVEVLRSLYKLTPAEAETAISIFGGSTPAEIASQRNTSIHTVRTQIKSVLFKCHVRSQVDLCRLLAMVPGVFI